MSRVIGVPEEASSETKALAEMDAKMIMREFCESRGQREARAPERDWEAGEKAGDGDKPQAPEEAGGKPVMAKAGLREVYRVGGGEEDMDNKGESLSLEELVESVQNEDMEQEARLKALHALSRLGEDARPAVPALIEVLQNGERDERWVAAYALGRIGDIRAVEPLIDAIKDEDIYAEAMYTLSVLGDPRSIEPLIDALDEAHTQRLAGEVLSGFGEAAVPLLIKVLLSESLHHFTRLEAGHALVKTGDPRSIEALRKAILFPQDQMSQRAYEHLLAEALLHEKGLSRAERLGRMMKRAEELLAKDEHLGDKLEWMLGKFGDQSVIPSLALHLRRMDHVLKTKRSSYPNIHLVKGNRTKIVRILGEIGHPSACDVLLETFPEKGGYTWIIALGKIGNPDATPRLARVLEEDQYMWVRVRAAESLTLIGGEAAPDSLAKSAQEDTERRVRCQAAQGLVELGDQRAKDPQIQRELPVQPWDLGFPRDLFPEEGVRMIKGEWFSPLHEEAMAALYEPTYTVLATFPGNLNLEEYFAVRADSAVEAEEKVMRIRKCDREGKCYKPEKVETLFFTLDGTEAEPFIPSETQARQEASKIRRLGRYIVL